MILLVDIGNSRLKWGQVSNDHFNFEGACQYSVIELPQILTTIWGGLPIEAVFIANVAGEHIAAVVVEWLWQTYQIKPRFLRSQHYFGNLINAYTHPARYGVDRWMTLIAGWQRYQSAFCVIDCGSAITVDAVSADGAHMGGLIVPGLSLLKTALTKGTQVAHSMDKPFDNLPSQHLLANDTYHGVMAGCYYSAVAFIRHITQDLIEEIGQPLPCLLTGGDAPNFLPLLTHEYEHRPHLVLEGLAIRAGFASAVI